MTIVEECSKTKTNETWKSFNTWYNKLLGKYYGFEANEAWFNKVNDRHKNIRGNIGGVRIVKTIKIEERQGPASLSLVANYGRSLLQYIPSLCKYIKDDFKELLYPTINIDGRQIRTGKAILRWYEDSVKNNEVKHTVYYTEDYAKQNVEYIISSLGREWSNSRCENKEFEISLSTSPRAFVLLGHYGPDADSCFHQGGANDDHKYILGQTKDTFVLLIKEDGKNIARFWGFAQEDGRLYTIANYYPEDGVKDGNTFEALRIFFSELFDISTDKLHYEHGLGDVENPIYFNGETWSFSDKKIKGHILIPKADDLESGKTCPHCDEYFHREDMPEFYQIDGQECCDYCLENANYCEYSGDSTFEEILTYKSSTGSIREAKISLLEDRKKFKVCLECNEYIQIEYAIEVGRSKFVCEECAKEDYELKNDKYVKVAV